MKRTLDTLEEADDVILGAGFSGLSAALRLAQFGRKVVVLEKHTLPGGLNSYYYRPGKRVYDSGLHVLTNRCPVSRRWGMPFVHRQLGLSPEQLPLYAPTAPSLVQLGDCFLHTPADGPALQEQIAAEYPTQADGWRALWELLKKDNLEPALAAAPAREVLERYLSDAQLIDLLRLPVFLYGGYAAGDITFLIFRNIFRSLFIEGVGHPGSIKPWLDALVAALKEAGGEVFYRANVVAIEHDSGVVQAVRLESGQRIRAANVVSSIGRAETEHLLASDTATPAPAPPVAGISAVETTFCLTREEAARACPHPMVFFHADERFDWDPAVRPFESYSISCAAHFDFPSEPEYCFFKIAAYLGGEGWLGLDEAAYAEKKEAARARLESELRHRLPGLLRIPGEALSETMTPRTVHRYTSHVDGAIYGGADKSFSGETAYKNLFLVGNDQGGIGVVGALISGIVVANLKILTGSR